MLPIKSPSHSGVPGPLLGPQTALATPPRVPPARPKHASSEHISPGPGKGLGPALLGEKELGDRPFASIPGPSNPHPSPGPREVPSASAPGTRGSASGRAADLQRCGGEGSAARILPRARAGPASSAPASPGPGRGLGPLSQWAPRSGPLPRSGRSRRRAAATEVVRDVRRRAPSSRPPPGSVDAPRPRKEAGTRCGRPARTRRPSARWKSSPGPAAPGPRAEPGSPRAAHDGRTACRAAGRPREPRGSRLCSGRGGPAAYGSPCCWAPWPRCAGGSRAPGARAAAAAGGALG